MTFQSVVLVLCCVIVAGLAQEEQNALLKLRTLVLDTSNKEKMVIRQNDELRNEIKAKQHGCQREIAGLKTSENVGNQVFKDLIEEMKRLKSKLAALSYTENVMTKELDSDKLNLDKLELDLILQNEDIHLLSSRRLSKESLRCMQLVNSSLTLEGRTLSDNYEFLLVNHELKLVMGRLNQETNRNEELKRKLEKIQALCIEEVKDFREEITELNGEIEKAKSTVNRFGALVEQAEDKINNLKKEAEHHNTREQEMREKLRKQIKQLDTFKKDQQCYTQLRKDVIEKFL